MDSINSFLFFISSNGVVNIEVLVFNTSNTPKLSKYGNTSPKTCPATGAATAPPWWPPSPVGLYKVTKIVTCGSEIGATPTNEVTYLFVFTPSSDVPVLPPTR